MRQLREVELPLVKALFEAAGFELYDSIRVEAIGDGGMGSLVFRKGAYVTLFKVAEIQFEDEDGTLVSAALNCTADGAPAEMDVRKVDFSPLIRWPLESELRCVKRQGQDDGR